MSRGSFLQEILQQENELGKSLDGLHHQAEEVKSVVRSDLLHLQMKTLPINMKNKYKSLGRTQNFALAAKRPL